MGGTFWGGYTEESAELSVKEIFVDAFPFAHGVSKDEESTRLQKRSLEYGYLDVISDSFREPKHLIGAAHYAIMLAACCIGSPGRAETANELKKLLSHRSLMIEQSKRIFSERTSHRIEELLEFAMTVMEVGRVPD
jgi:hypothetical protein